MGLAGQFRHHQRRRNHAHREAREPRQQAVVKAAAVAQAHAARVEGQGGQQRGVHLALVRPGGRQITAQLVERLQVLAERYVRKHLEPAGREARAASEHRAILEAWLARDAALVSRLLSEHIVTTLHDLRQQLEHSAAEAPPPAPPRRGRRRSPE